MNPTTAQAYELAARLRRLRHLRPPLPAEEAALARGDDDAAQDDAAAASNSARDGLSGGAAAESDDGRRVLPRAAPGEEEHLLLPPADASSSLRLRLEPSSSRRPRPAHDAADEAASGEAVYGATAAEGDLAFLPVVGSSAASPPSVWWARASEEVEALSRRLAGGLAEVSLSGARADARARASLAAEAAARAAEVGFLFLFHPPSSPFPSS